MFAMNLLCYYSVDVPVRLHLPVPDPAGADPEGSRRRLSSAFGGAGGSTAFGSKTGDVLTWATSVVFGVFMLLAIALNLVANHRQDAAANTTVATPATPHAVACAESQHCRPASSSEFHHRRNSSRLASRMIVSMTGFGDATAERDGTHYAVEIRSLNNRFFKPIIKLPDNLSGLEPELESMLREKLGRGSITYILKMRIDSAEAAYHINIAALKAYLEQLQQVKGLDRFVQIDLASLVQLPGVCQEPRDETDEIARHGDDRSRADGTRRSAGSTRCAGAKARRCSRS